MLIIPAFKEQRQKNCRLLVKVSLVCIANSKSAKPAWCNTHL